LNRPDRALQSRLAIRFEVQAHRLPKPPKTAQARLGFDQDCPALVVPRRLDFPTDDPGNPSEIDLKDGLPSFGSENERGVQCR
jgi:hypothetical protein